MIKATQIAEPTQYKHFNKDTSFTNNAIIQYLKSSSDSKFLCNEQLFVLNKNNNNNNDNKEKLACTASPNPSDFIDSGKTKLGLQFERFEINFKLNKLLLN